MDDREREELEQLVGERDPGMVRVKAERDSDGNPVGVAALVWQRWAYLANIPCRTDDEEHELRALRATLDQTDLETWRERPQRARAEALAPFASHVERLAFEVAVGFEFKDHRRAAEAVLSLQEHFAQRLKRDFKDLQVPEGITAFDRLEHLIAQGPADLRDAWAAWKQAQAAESVALSDQA